MTQATKTTSRPRPLSPHLQIYRLPLEALTSISHRASGVVLTGATVVQVAWLFAVASNPDYFKWWQSFLLSPLGLALMGAWSLALFYHLSAGLRHLIWDAGFALGKKASRISSFVVVLSAITMTAITWWIVWPKLPLPQ